jgi:hypothetical protein
MSSFSRTLATIASALSITNFNGTFANNLTVTGNTTTNNATVTNTLTVGTLTATNGSITLGTSSFTNNNIFVGNSTVNTNISNSSIVVANSTSSITIGSGYINSSNTNLVGATSISSMLENMSIVSTRITLFNTINFDVLSQSSQYYTNSLGPQGSWTLNVRGNSTTTLNSIMTIGQSVTITQLINQGSGATYFPSSLTIDGVSQTIKYQFGNAFSYDPVSTVSAFSFTIVKTANNTYTVFASQTRYS